MPAHTVQVHIKADKYDGRGTEAEFGPIGSPPRYDLHYPATCQLYKRGCASEVSDQRVVSIANPAMLAFLRGVADIPDSVLEELDNLDTFTRQAAARRAASLGKCHDGPCQPATRGQRGR